MKESELKISMNSVASEMENLKGIKVVEIDEMYILFTCEDDKILRFLAHECASLVHEYEGKSYGQIMVSPKERTYMLSFIMVKKVDMNKVIMSMASSIDAAACDVPELFNC